MIPRPTGAGWVMWRFLLVGLACVPLVLWGVDGVGGTTAFLEPKKPAAANPPEPPESSAVLAGHEDVAAAFALKVPPGDAVPPEPGTNDTPLQQAAANHRRALAEAARFAAKMAAPVDDQGEPTAKETDFQNAILAKAWKGFADRARQAHAALAKLQDEPRKKKLVERLQKWLKELPERSEEWKPFRAEDLREAEEASDALTEFEKDHRGQSYLVSKAARSRGEWDRAHAAMKGVNDAADELKGAKEKQAVRLKQLLHLADLVDLASPAGNELKNARAAANRLCDKLLPYPRPLGDKVIVKWGDKNQIELERRRLKIRWKDREDEEKYGPEVGDGTGKNAADDAKKQQNRSELDLGKGSSELKKVRYFHWDRATEMTPEGTGAHLELTPLSQTIHKYNQAVADVQGGSWNKKALRRVYEVLAALGPYAEEFLGKEWATLERLLRPGSLLFE